MSISVDEWLRSIEEPSCASRPEKRPFKDVEKVLKRKRRRLIDPPRSTRARAWSENDVPPASELRDLLREELPGTESLTLLPKMAARQTNPPITPSSSGNNMPPPSRRGGSARRARSGSRTRSGSRGGSAGLAESAYSEATSTSRQSKDKIQSASYRQDVLLGNGIAFRPEWEPLPLEIRLLYDQIFQPEERTISRMTLAEATNTRQIIWKNDSVVEKKFLQHLQYPGPFPATEEGQSPYQDKMFCAEGQEFHKEAVPASGRLFVPKVSVPFPDYAYGYSREAFDPIQAAFLAQSRIYKLATDLMCPFFIIEGKSQSHGGNCWQASNQCAGGGSACVVAALALHEEQADPAEDGLQTADFVAFSLAIDNVSAILYVHWCEAPGNYFLQNVQEYHISKPRDLMKLATHLENIMAWGMGTRLTKIKNTVSNIIEEKGGKRGIDDVEE